MNIISQKIIFQFIVAMKMGRWMLWKSLLKLWYVTIQLKLTLQRFKLKFFSSQLGCWKYALQNYWNWKKNSEEIKGDNFFEIWKCYVENPKGIFSEFSKMAKRLREVHKHIISSSIKHQTSRLKYYKMHARWLQQFISVNWQFYWYLCITICSITFIS